MRFLVFSDLHLDQHVEGVGMEALARRRADLRTCLDRILTLADTQRVDAILSAGDLYDHEHVQPSTVRLLVDRLEQARRPVFLAPGDRDPHVPDSVYATAAWPANVHVFDDDLLVPVELAAGFRLWGAAHRSHGDTPGFLDGFRIRDDGVDLALFHGTEVGSRSHGTTAVVAPFRADQVESAGLTHAFVGHGCVAVDGPWHTVPGLPAAVADGPQPRGAVVVDVAPDGSLRRERFDVAVPPVHEVTIDVTGAATTDEVLERLLTSVEDLQGTARVHLQGRPAPGVVVHDEELTAWSTERLEVVVGRRPAVPPRHLDVGRPAVVAAPLPPQGPSNAVRAQAWAAHDEWRLALAALRRHTHEEPAPVVRPELGGMALGTLEAHLQALQAPPATLDPEVAAEVARLEAPPRRRRSPARTVAAVVTVSAGLGLIVAGDTILERGVAVAAIVIVAVLTVVLPRRRSANATELTAARTRARFALLDTMERNAALDRARHQAVTALQQAGLPAEPDALAELVEAARRAEAWRSMRTAWEQRRAQLARRLVEVTSSLRAVLEGAGVTDTLDLEAAWMRFEAGAGAGPRRQWESTTAASVRSARHQP